MAAQFPGRKNLSPTRVWLDRDWFLICSHLERLMACSRIITSHNLANLGYQLQSIGFQFGASYSPWQSRPLLWLSSDVTSTTQYVATLDRRSIKPLYFKRHFMYENFRCCTIIQLWLLRSWNIFFRNRYSLVQIDTKKYVTLHFTCVSF